MRHREKERESGRDTGRGRSRLHAGSPTRDLILGLDPGTPGSCPRLKAGAKLLSHPGIPDFHSYLYYALLSGFFGLSLCLFF